MSFFPLEECGIFSFSSGFLNFTILCLNVVFLHNPTFACGEFFFFFQSEILCPSGFIYFLVSYILLDVFLELLSDDGC